MAQSSNYQWNKGPDNLTNAQDGTSRLSLPTVETQFHWRDTSAWSAAQNNPQTSENLSSSPTQEPSQSARLPLHCKLYQSQQRMLTGSVSKFKNFRIWSPKNSNAHAINVALNKWFLKISNCCWRENAKLLLTYCRTLPIPYTVDRCWILFYKKLKCRSTSSV